MLSDRSGQISRISASARLADRARQLGFADVRLAADARPASLVSAMLD